jgi:hypothetical protein
MLGFLLPPPPGTICLVGAILPLLLAIPPISNPSIPMPMPSGKALALNNPALGIPALCNPVAGVANRSRPLAPERALRSISRMRWYLYLDCKDINGVETSGDPAYRAPLRGFVCREREMADMTASRSSSLSTLPESKSSANGALASIAAPITGSVYLRR